MNEHSNEWAAVKDLYQINPLRVAISLVIVLAEMHTVTAFCIHFGVSQTS